MKNLKGIVGLLFLLSFCYQLFEVFSTNSPSMANQEEFAIRVGTSLAVSLVLGILLIRSALKKTTPKDIK